MAEPSLTNVNTNLGVVALSTIVLGPMLGEYAIIAGLGLVGTLIALSENNRSSIWESIVFLFKGVMFSCVFTGIATSIMVKYLPGDMGLTPYAIMGPVAFTIGWSSDRIAILKISVMSFISHFFNKSPEK